MAFNPGFMGLASIGGSLVRCTDFNVNLEQEALFYDHIIGLLDTIPTSLGSKGEGSTVNVQKTFWRPGVKLIRGSLNFPATVDILTSVFNLAKKGGWFSLDLAYHCKLKRTYPECRVNSLTLSVSSGDIVNVTLDVMGRKFTESSSGLSYLSTEKLVTWDKVNLTATNTTSPLLVSQFEVTINNNCIPIYTSGYNTTGSLYPKDIRIGMQEVTGTISFMNNGTSGNPLGTTTTQETINLSIDSFSLGIPCIYKPIQRSSDMRLPISTLGFMSVGKLT